MIKIKLMLELLFNLYERNEQVVCKREDYKKYEKYLVPAKRMKRNE